MNDLISIIMTVYNNEKYLDEAINSLRIQSYTNVEIIIVDDGSIDNSLQICRKYENQDKRIKVISQINNGVSSARNLGLDNSNGKYIAFVDSDDYIEKNYIERLYNMIIKDDIDCVGCGYYRIYNSEKQAIISNNPYKIDMNDFQKKILEVESGLGFCHMKLWKKECIQNIRFNEKLKVGEDALFCMEVSKNMKTFYMINEPLYNYRVNINSLVKKYDPMYVEKYLNAMIEMEKYVKQIEAEEIKNKIFNYISFHIMLIVVNFCFNPENNLKCKEQIKELKRVCKIETFEKSINKSSYEGFSLTKKITLFTLKYKLYFFTMIIGKIRQHKIRK